MVFYEFFYVVVGDGYSSRDLCLVGFVCFTFVNNIVGDF